MDVVPNDRYRLERYIIPSENYVKTFEEKVNKNVGMVYGRLDISPQHFLDEAILNIFIIDNKEKVSPLTKSSFDPLKRLVFQGSVGNDYGKEFRWNAEKYLGEFITNKYVSRNQLLNQDLTVLENHSGDSTDILQEYFIPKENVNQFIKELKKIVPKYKIDLLNITIRNVLKDNDTFLNYAKEDVFGFVMFFNQKKTTDGEKEMERFTQEITNAVLELKGTYYLPYRLHATNEEFEKAYPQAKQFFELKKKYDPNEVFQNLWYLKYK